MNDGATDLRGACAFLSLGRTSLLAEVYAGCLPVVRHGRRLIFRYTDLRSWLDARAVRYGSTSTSTQKYP